MEQTEDRNRSREIVLINRTETKPLSRWNKIEQVSRALSLGAIPVVLAIGGWWIQNALSERSVNKDYVALAVSILSKSDKEVDEGLRSWAVDLLNANSPVKFDPKVSQKLSSGEITLPAVSSTFQPITELPENDPRRTIVRSIGRLSIAGTEGDFSCSAWLISEEYLLTADFCVGESPTDIKLTLGSSGENQSNGTTYQVENRPYELNHKLGYAILKVSGAPGAKYGHLRIAFATPRARWLGQKFSRRSTGQVSIPRVAQSA